MTRDVLAARWSDIGEKLVALADAFPAEHYDWRPTPEVRSYADQLRHLAFWNLHVGQILRREAADGEANELPRDAYSTKPELVSVLRESAEAVREELARGGTVLDARDHDLVVSFIAHNGEHYGQLVVYHRLKGLVPPASRAS